jgi:hypothetical protein
MITGKSNVYALIAILDCMASIPTPTKTRLRDRFFFLPNLVLWLMLWLLYFSSDLGIMILLIPCYVSFLGMSASVVYDKMRSGGLTKALAPLSDDARSKRLLIALPLVIIAIALWLVGMFYDSLSWLSWNSVAGFNLAFAYAIVLDSSD